MKGASASAPTLRDAPPVTLEVAARRLARAEAQVRALERLIEDKSRELYTAARTLEEIFEAAPVGLFVCDADLRIHRANAAAVSLVRRPLGELTGALLPAVLGVPSLADLAHAREHASREIQYRADPTSPPVPIAVSIAHGEAQRVLVCRDLSRERSLEVELRHAQKLEAVGQLAAGVAHEINTPIQFVGDSVYFLRDAFAEVLEVVRGTRSPEDADLPYLLENVPGAFARCDEGVARVTEIVRALKELSHPDGREKAPSDLNRAVGNAIVVSRNETKLVADVETDLGELPLVECHVGDLGQVLLNLIVNAAHAIEERLEKQPERGPRGRIVITTRALAGSVRIDVADDAMGIPAEVAEHVFEPFFTTKPVGRGTGQGLSIARAIVVERHGGQLSFTTERGRGTTFHVSLPLRAAQRGARRSAG